VLGETPDVSFPKVAPGASVAKGSGTRTVFYDTAYLEAAIFSRRDFGAGTTAVGPAVIEDDDLTVWIPPSWGVRGDDRGILMIERSSSDAS